MATIGIIAEFNPFHNGHKYLIEEAKRITGADRAIIVMSGNYVQRGSPAIVDKFTRTKIALQNGADLVIELPICYAVSSAAYFANGAVRVLDSLNCVDFLCFGSEFSDISILSKIAQILASEPEDYKLLIKKYLKDSFSFVKSRESAITEYLNNEIDSKLIASILNSPNSILAIEYIATLYKIKSKITPIPIKRSDNGYHSDIAKNNFASASAIRKLILDDDSLQSINYYCPSSCFEILNKNYKKNFPLHEDDFNCIVGYSLLNLKKLLNESNEFFDISNDLLNRIINNTYSFSSISSFVNQNNSKVFTSGYIRRALITILINYKKEDYQKFKDENYIFYIRILGFKKQSTDLLTSIKTNCNLPMISKISDSYSLLSNTGKRMLTINLDADEIYRIISNTKFAHENKTEYQNGVVIL